MSKLSMQLEYVSDESCGFLLGTTYSDGGGEVLEFIEVANSEQSNKKNRYLIHPTDFIKVERMACEANLEIIGVYHTHINQEALLSSTDKKFAFPQFFYLILSMVNFKFSHARCWRMDNEGIFKEIPINVVDK